MIDCGTIGEPAESQAKATIELVDYSEYTVRLTVFRLTVDAARQLRRESLLERELVRDVHANLRNLFKTMTETNKRLS
jgi:hypothetical protein